MPESPAALSLSVAGLTVGTVCAYDLKPRQLRVAEVEARRLAGIITALGKPRPLRVRVIPEQC